MTASRRPYRTDLSDARWALIEPILAQWRAGRVGLGIAPIQHDLREIVNAVLYVNRTGIPWEYLPHDFLHIMWAIKLLGSGDDLVVVRRVVASSCVDCGS